MRGTLCRSRLFRSDHVEAGRGHAVTTVLTPSGMVGEMSQTHPPIEWLSWATRLQPTTLHSRNDEMGDCMPCIQYLPKPRRRVYAISYPRTAPPSSPFPSGVTGPSPPLCRSTTSLFAPRGTPRPRHQAAARRPSPRPCLGWSAAGA